jgi:hypothetical protein
MTLRVVTWVPGRSTLLKGPNSVVTLSPATSMTRVAIAGRPGIMVIQPEVSAVAVISEVTSTLSLFSAMVRTVHLPATSARLIGAGAGAATAVVSCAGGASGLLHPATTAAQQSETKNRMVPP